MKEIIIKMKHIIITILLLFAAMGVSAQGDAEMSKEEIYKQEIREKLKLDYSMPDYSITKIDAKVMGQRLASILTRINETYAQLTNLGALSVIQTSQIEGMSYGRVKKMKLNSVVKKGNEIRIDYNTTMEPNNMNIKNANLFFVFIDGVSENKSANDFLTNICRYIKK